MPGLATNVFSGTPAASRSTGAVRLLTCSLRNARRTCVQDPILEKRDAPGPPYLGTLSCLTPLAPQLTDILVEGAAQAMAFTLTGWQCNTVGPSYS
jgi:hypothetical protein